MRLFPIGVIYPCPRGATLISRLVAKGTLAARNVRARHREVELAGQINSRRVLFLSYIPLLMLLRARRANYVDDRGPVKGARRGVYFHGWWRNWRA